MSFELVDYEALKKAATARYLEAFDCYNETTQGVWDALLPPPPPAPLPAPIAPPETQRSLAEWTAIEAAYAVLKRDPLTDMFTVRQNSTGYTLELASREWRSVVTKVEADELFYDATRR